MDVSSSSLVDPISGDSHARLCKFCSDFLLRDLVARSFGVLSGSLFDRFGFVVDFGLEFAELFVVSNCLSHSEHSCVFG